MATLPDNMKRCCDCGRPVPRNPTLNERQLHQLKHELEDAVLSKNNWTRLYHQARRSGNTLSAMEAQEQVNEYINEIDRLMYYATLAETAIDGEQQRKR